MKTTPVTYEGHPLIEESAEWFHKSADGGYPEAQIEYGRALMRGGMVAKDVVEGLKYLLLAAEQNDQEAAKLLREHDATGPERAEVRKRAEAWKKEFGEVP